MANEEIRRRAARNGIRLWQLAAALGISDCNFSRKMRNEFSPEEKERILSIIEAIAKEELYA